MLKEINVIRQALNWRGVNGARFEAPPASPPRDRHLTKAEYKRLLGGCSSPHMRLFCVLALTTAARKTAILQLTWDRVDFDRKLIMLGIVGDKNRKGRATVPMTETVRLPYCRRPMRLDSRPTWWNTVASACSTLKRALLELCVVRA